jgi:hypothetical protein
VDAVYGGFVRGGHRPAGTREDPKMNVQSTVRVDAPIHTVWGFLAEDFTGIAHWASQVVSARPLDDAPVLPGARVAGRYCAFTDDPDGFGAREQITGFDPENHTLNFDFEPVNGPRALPVLRNHVEVVLRSLPGGMTEVVWTASPELTWFGVLLTPVLKLGLRKSFDGLLRELKTHIESELSHSAAS